LKNPIQSNPKFDVLLDSYNSQSNPPLNNYSYIQQRHFPLINGTSVKLYLAIFII
jgi:hypothetical protein